MLDSSGFTSGIEDYSAPGGYQVVDEAGLRWDTMMMGKKRNKTCAGMGEVPPASEETVFGE